jgi:hypothetical protein
MSWLVQLWHEHGTRILGITTTVVSSITAFLAYLTSQPSVAFLLPPKWFAVFALVTAVLGYLTHRRGTVNAARLGCPNDNP